jgi:hypothetical protein
MRNLQTTLINRYQTAYPTDTLKEISSKTGIQITRVFRLFNGSEMKISEYESFERTLEKNETHSEFYQLTKRCFSHLNQDRLEYLTTLMKHSLKLIDIKTNSIKSQNQIELA